LKEIAPNRLLRFPYLPTDYTHSIKPAGSFNAEIDKAHTQSQTAQIQFSARSSN